MWACWSRWLPRCRPSQGQLVTAGGLLTFGAAVAAHPNIQKAPNQSGAEELVVLQKKTFAARMRTRLSRAVESPAHTAPKRESYISGRVHKPLIALGKRAHELDDLYANDKETEAYLAKVVAEASKEDEAPEISWWWGLAVIMLMPMWPWAYMFGRKQRVSADRAAQFARFGGALDDALNRQANSSQWDRYFRPADRSETGRRADPHMHTFYEQASAAQEQARREREAEWRKAQHRARLAARQAAERRWRAKQAEAAAAKARQHSEGVLGAGHHSSDAELRAAFRAMVLKHHPDRHANAPEDVKSAHAARFKAGREAYEKLCKARGIVP